MVGGEPVGPGRLSRILAEGGRPWAAAQDRVNTKCALMSRPAATVRRMIPPAKRSLRASGSFGREKRMAEHAAGWTAMRRPCANATKNRLSMTGSTNPAGMARDESMPLAQASAVASSTPANQHAAARITANCSLPPSRSGRTALPHSPRSPRSSSHQSMQRGSTS